MASFIFSEFYLISDEFKYVYLCFRAVASGTEMLELDVRLTKDGKVVVFHDKDMRRLTGLSGSVSDFNYDQLPPLNVSVDIDTIPGT